MGTRASAPTNISSAPFWFVICFEALVAPFESLMLLSLGATVDFKRFFNYLILRFVSFTFHILGFSNEVDIVDISWFRWRRLSLINTAVWSAPLSCGRVGCKSHRTSWIHWQSHTEASQKVHNVMRSHAPGSRIQRVSEWRTYLNQRTHYTNWSTIRELNAMVRELEHTHT